MKYALVFTTAIMLTNVPAIANAGWAKFVETTHNTIANSKCWQKAFTFGKTKGCENN